MYSGDQTSPKYKIQLILSIYSKDLKHENFFSTINIDLLTSLPNDKKNMNILGSTYCKEDEESNFGFDTMFYMDYFFEKHQYIKLNIFSDKIKLGVFETSLGSIMGAKGQTIEFPFKYGQPEREGFIEIKGISVKEEITNCLVKLEVKANLYGVPYSDYFILVKNSKNGIKQNKIWKSNEETGKEFLFQANDIYFNDLCTGDLNKPIFIEFFRANYGQVTEICTTLKSIELLAAKNESFVLKNLSTGIQIGTCKINFGFEKIVTFIDYVEKGLQISLAVGIDYTSSNGNPNEANSLHYIFGKEPNNYEQAITSCGSIISNYTFDHQYPVYGFGAVLRDSPFANHCFSLNFKKSPNVTGIDGIITAYRNSLQRVQLDGPTYFQPLIKNSVEYVKSQMSKLKSSIYYILLILTDGQIHDMQETKNIIVEAAYLPLSIIIVGIGDENFQNMIELDGDKVPILNKKGEKVQRDIVQFVCFNDFKMDSVKLSEEVLKEVPKQAEQYYRKYKNFKAI
jgi:hypothetical protein